MDSSETRSRYIAPAINDYGKLEELTANDGIPVVVDVPQGSPVGSSPVVGSDPSFS